jgi:spore germination cell wall hydrolase CwlJ-like protein
MALTHILTKATLAGLGQRSGGFRQGSGERLLGVWTSMRRKSAVSWALAAMCWSALVMASAAAVVLLVKPDAAAPDSGIDIVRSAVAADPHWRLQPVSASASRLFFAGGKGPRADVEAAGPDDQYSPPSTTVQLASVSRDEAATALLAAPARLAGLSSLANHTQRVTEAACLAEVIYFEARGQPVDAQIAVGQTVINRALSGVYPRTLCGVAHQHDEHSGECQYSFACDGLTGISKSRPDWQLAQELSVRLLSGAVWLPEIGDATHSHALAEHPAWVKYLQRVKRIGAIVFYRGDFASAGMPIAGAAD